MNDKEKELQQILRKSGYRLVKRDSGYQVADAVTESVYLGKKYDATLQEVSTFVDNIDEGGYSDLSPYTDEREAALDDGFAIELDMDLINLTRHRDTLLLQGKFFEAGEVDAKIEELEKELGDEDAYIQHKQEVRACLDEHGFRMERGFDGYRVVEKATGEVRLGKNYDADIDDVADFASNLPSSLTP